MPTTASDAWDTLSAHEQSLADDSGRDGFFLGFSAGWKAQENRPFHCAHCGFECHGATDAATIALAREHTRTCEAHPLSARIRYLENLLARAYPLLHNPYGFNDDVELAEQYDAIIREVEVAIQHLPDDKEH